VYRGAVAGGKTNILGPVALMRAGQKGVIVEVYSQDGDGYDVEFFDNEGYSGADDHDRGGHQTE
jgi:hypothetical protein